MKLPENIINYAASQDFSSTRDLSQIGKYPLSSGTLSNGIPSIQFSMPHFDPNLNYQSLYISTYLSN